MPPYIPSPVTQADRLLSIVTTLDFDTLLIESFTGEEGVSQPFRFVAQLLADRQYERDREVRPEELIGEKATIRVALPNGAFRHINGIIRRFTKGRPDGRFMRYRAEIVPWLWRLTLTSDCRIFQDKTVPQILEEIFDELGFQGQYRFELKREYTPWDYCVQYRETDFNFVSRLMEAEGIFYYFEHSEQEHILVLGDTAVIYPDCPGQSEVRLRDEMGEGEREDAIVHCGISRALYPGQSALRDYHFELPNDPLEVTEPTMVPERQSEDWEIFD